MINIVNNIGTRGRTYLDYAATTPTHPDVITEMIPYFGNRFGNPSSIYSYGHEAKQAIEHSRRKVAELISAGEDEIIFTSGGTESDNMALKGVVAVCGDKKNHIITTNIEHHAVLNTCRFLEKSGCIVRYLSVDKNGMVDPDDVRKSITDKTLLISIMHANNEVGTIEPIAEISKIARESGVLFHSDAVQTAGHIPVDVNELGVDLLSVSAHKFHGPKGIGALYVRKGTKIGSIIHGGEQEKGRRASTENVPGIVGMGKAAEIQKDVLKAEAELQTSLRDRLIKGLLSSIDHSRLNGHPVRRLPNNVNISFDYVEGESIVLSLDMEGICASTGSACSSANLEASHVLLALGLSHERSHGSCRFSLGKWTRVEDIDRVIEIMPDIVARLRKMSPLFTGSN
ncbi:MAG: cysteine desulfurase NifS [Dehalococcoidales bacterium]|nr:MAG: cysteine desulfurase NifS [Dehalococcoidales bacterium]